MVFNSVHFARLLRRRLRASTGCWGTARRTGCCSPRATTSTRPGTGASPACSPRRRWSATPRRWRLAADARARSRRAALWPALGFHLRRSASSSTPASSPKRRARCSQSIGAARRFPDARTSSCRSGSRSTRSWRWPTSSTSIAARCEPTRDSSTSRCSSPTSRTSSPGRFCAPGAAAADRGAAARSAASDVSTGAVADRRRPVQEDGRRRQRRPMVDADLRSGASARTALDDPARRPTPSRCRSTATSPATRTSRAASRS